MDAIAKLGTSVGALISPAVAWLSRWRQARMFHPAGIVCAATVTARTRHPVAARLAGPAIVRLSGALWKEAESWDVLGAAVRFGGVDGDQDLLLATILRPWTMGLAMLTTNPHDFLSNAYDAVSPVAVDDRRMELRLRPLYTGAAGSTRAERLEGAITDGRARFSLDWAPYRKPWQLLDDSPFEPLVEIELTQLIDVDQAELAFNPFHDGRGLTPVGFIHSIRRAVYPASQQGRSCFEARNPERVPNLRRSAPAQPTLRYGKTELKQ